MRKRYTQADVDAMVAELKRAEREVIDCDNVEVIAHHPERQLSILRFERKGTDVFISVPSAALAEAMAGLLSDAIEAFGDGFRDAVRRLSEL